MHAHETPASVASRFDLCKQRPTWMDWNPESHGYENRTSGLLEVDPVVQHANQFARIEALPIRLLPG